MKAALTGATGFVGGALVDLLIEENISVAMLARDPARVKVREGVSIVKGDLDDEDALAALAEGADFFIHLAGVTFPRDDADFDRVNVAGAANAARAAAKAGANFVHASSMSAREPHVSPYAASKRQSETAVAEASGENPWVALRLPAIYGPGDHATLPYFKLIKSGLALEPRTEPPARASLLYVRDAARALCAAACEPLANSVYEVGDETPRGREWREIGETLGNIMNKKVKRLRVPKPAVALFHNVSRGAARIAGQSPSVRTGQAEEFFHPDWAARDNLFTEHSAWRAETQLKEGFAKTLLWYQENALL